MPIVFRIIPSKVASSKKDDVIRIVPVDSKQIRITYKDPRTASGSLTQTVRVDSNHLYRYVETILALLTTDDQPNYAFQVFFPALPTAYFQIQNLWDPAIRSALTNSIYLTLESWFNSGDQSPSGNKTPTATSRSSEDSPCSASYYDGFRTHNFYE